MWHNNIHIFPNKYAQTRTFTILYTSYTIPITFPLGSVVGANVLISDAADTYRTDYHFWACVLYSFALMFLFLSSCLFHSFFMLPTSKLDVCMLYDLWCLVKCGVWCLVYLGDCDDMDKPSSLRPK
ncbi:hypothetical protein EON63_17865 [archaeon]|nr:MAG: hypothetical protein EON63_17865 [archaeon]